MQALLPAIRQQRPLTCLLQARLELVYPRRATQGHFLVALPRYLSQARLKRAYLQSQVLIWRHQATKLPSMMGQSSSFSLLARAPVAAKRHPVLRWMAQRMRLMPEVQSLDFVVGQTFFAKVESKVVLTKIEGEKSPVIFIFINRHRFALLIDECK